jgi:hypothetical protein
VTAIVLIALILSSSRRFIQRAKPSTDPVQVLRYE